MRTNVKCPIRLVAAKEFGVFPALVVDTGSLFQFGSGVDDFTEVQDVGGGNDSSFTLQVPKPETFSVWCS